MRMEAGKIDVNADEVSIDVDAFAGSDIRIGGKGEMPITADKLAINLSSDAHLSGQVAHIVCYSLISRSLCSVAG